MFGLAHRAVLLAPAEDAFDHRSTRLRHAIAFVPRGASVDGAPTTLAGCGDAVVLRHMRRNVDGAQMGHMVGRVIGLIFAHRDAAACLLGFGLEHDLRSAALGGAVGERDHARHRQPMAVLHGGEAHASISVPSTEKCSSDNSGLTSGWFRSLLMNLANTAPVCSRSRFFVKVVGSQIGASGESPTNQRYKRL